MNFLANENFPLLSVRRLREAGHHVVCVAQETPGSKDEIILERAHNEGLIILTFDRDYGELIFRYRALPPPGVVYFRFTPASPSEPAEIFLNIVNKKILSFTGKFTVIERGRVRQRLLRISDTQSGKESI